MSRVIHWALLCVAAALSSLAHAEGTVGWKLISEYWASPVPLPFQPNNWGVDGWRATLLESCTDLDVMNSGSLVRYECEIDGRWTRHHVYSEPSGTLVDPGNWMWSQIRTSKTCPPASAPDATGTCVCNPGYKPGATGQACEPAVFEESSCSVGDPVLPGSGRALHEEIDYSGAGAAPLQLHRYYRSIWSDGTPAAGLAPIGAWTGGWRFSVQARLSDVPGGPLRAVRPDGSTVVFEPSTATPASWIAQSSRDTLTEQRNSAGQRSGWTYTASADDSVESYDASGQLQSVVARNGWRTTLGYDAAGRPAGSRACAIPLAASSASATTAPGASPR